MNVFDRSWMAVGPVTGIFLFFSAIAFAQTEMPSSPGETEESMMEYLDESSSQYLWQFDTSLNYASGDYGSSSTTHTFYWPFSLTRFFEYGDLGLTLPLIYQDSGAGVSAIGGRAFRTNQNFLGGGDDAGVGDILLKGRYYLLDEPDKPFDLSAVGQVKFPSADEDEGLGTGEFDQTFGLESRKDLQGPWTLYADMYFTHIGDPPGINLDNEFAFDVGAGYDLDERTQATLYYAERTALIDGRDNPREVILGLNHDIAPDTNIYGNIGFGVSDGSPDVAAGVGLAYLY